LLKSERIKFSAEAQLFLFSESGGFRFNQIAHAFEAGAPIPEPATLLLVGMAACGLFARRRDWFLAS
jgi:hypothetical protein